MPKIPEFGGVETRPLDVPMGGPDPSALATAGDGLNSIGQGAQATLGSLASVYFHEKKKAQEESVANGLTALTREGNDALYNPETGVHSKLGDEALLAAGTADDRIRKKQQEIANGLQDDEARKAFIQHSSRLVEDYHRTAEVYAGQQRMAAREASAEALQAQSLDALAGTYADPETRANLIAQPERAIRGLSRSTEEADAKTAAWRGRANGYVLNSYLAENTPEGLKGAEDYLKDPDVRASLGQQLPTYTHRLQVQKQQQVNDDAAQRMVSDHLDENGRPIEGAIWSEVEKQPPGESRQHLEAQVQQHISRAMRAYDQAESDRLGRVVTGIEQSGGALDRSTDDFQRLSPADKAKALERRNTMLRTDKSEQGKLDREELARFSALPREDQAGVDVNTQFPQASQTARYQMQKLQKDVRAKQASGDLEPLHEFDSQVKGASVQLKLAKPLAEQLKAQMDSWYMAQQRANNGKPPTRQQVDAEFSSQLQARDGLLGFGRTFRFQVPQGEDFEPHGDQPYEAVRARAGTPGKPAAAAPKAKSVSGYRWNKARTMRKPVYSDGTEGPPETANGG